MEAKDFAKQLKETVEDLQKEEGLESIKSQNLITHLNNFINSPESSLSQAGLEKYKAELQVWVEKEKRSHAGDIEMFRSVITAGQNALRTSFLMNGGAAVALLAFLGKLAEDHNSNIPIFAVSLLLFVCGILSIVITSGLTYVGQCFYAHGRLKSGGVCQLLCISLGFISYAFFAWGSLVAYEAFSNFSR